MTRALLAGALALMPLHACVCTQDVPMHACFDVPEDENGNIAEVRGPAILADGGASFANCPRNDFKHEIVVDVPVGSASFGWEHPDIDLSVDLTGELVVDGLGVSWEREASFVIHDEVGLAAAISAANGGLALPGVAVDRGHWRATGASICGIYSHTDTKVTVDGEEPRFVASGESVPVVVEGVPFTFHAFASSKFEFPYCTDLSSPLNWALIRDAQ